jgi:hypothetical protein
MPMKTHTAKTPELIMPPFTLHMLGEFTTSPLPMLTYSACRSKRFPLKRTNVRNDELATCTSEKNAVKAFNRRRIAWFVVVIFSDSLLHQKQGAYLARQAATFFAFGFVVIQRGTG